MTTIAYKDGIVATDSRVTNSRGKIVSDNEVKITESKNSLWILSGANYDIEYFIKNFVSVEKPIVFEDPIEAVSGFLIHEGAMYRLFGFQNNLLFEFLLTTKDYSKNDLTLGLGSGADFAIAAMDFGRNPMQAIEYAKTRDSNTGGEIRYLLLGEKQIRTHKSDN